MTTDDSIIDETVDDDDDELGYVDTVPAYLQPTVTSRGFKHMPELNVDYGSTVRLYESSAANAPHVWLSVTAPANPAAPEQPRVTTTAHMHINDLEALRDQIDYLLENHYQLS